MRVFVVVVLSLLLAKSSWALKTDSEYRAARVKGADTKITLSVCDDFGNALSNAQVRVRMGMNFGPKGYWIEGASDRNGFFTIEGKTCGDEIEIFVAKDGYYNGYEKICYAKMGAEHEVVNSRWQPWNEVKHFNLRKVCKPIGLVKLKMREFQQTTRISQWIGFDFEKRDFVAPYGKGETADFDIFFNWNKKWIPDYTGMSVQIRFTSQYSGYYQTNAVTTSDFKGPYHANPDAAFKKDAEFHSWIMADDQRDKKYFDKSKCWVMRTRCKVDEQGNLVSANYSVVHNIEFGCDKDGVALFCIMGALNPTPNDTNLEAKK